MARLWANLQGPAKEVDRLCKPQDFEDARRVERLLRILRESPLASMPVPDAYKKIRAYDQIRRRPGEVIGDYIVREQRAFREMNEALRRVRNSRNEKSASPVLQRLWLRSDEPAPPPQHWSCRSSVRSPSHCSILRSEGRSHGLKTKTKQHCTCEVFKPK